MEPAADITLTVFVVGLLILAAMAVTGLFDRMRLPPLIGYIALGLLLNAVDDRLGLLGSSGLAVLDFLARAGIIALLFRIGLESDVIGLSRQLRSASVAWVSNVIVAAAAGFVTVRYLFSFDTVASVVTATAFTATSVGIPTAVWRRRELLDTAPGRRFLDIAELDDISAIVFMAMLFAVLADIQGGSVEFGSLAMTFLAFTAKFLLFAGGCLLFARYAEKPITEAVRRLETPPAPMLTVLGLGFIIASIAGMLGFSEAIGAFLAGLAFSRDPDRVKLDASIGPIHDLLAPFFFIGIGLTMPLKGVGAGLLIGIVLAIAAGLSKVMGAGLPALRDLGGIGALAIGVSMIPRAEITMVVMSRAQGQGAVPPRLFSAMVVVTLITALVAPLALDRRILPELRGAGEIRGLSRSEPG